MCRGLGRFGVRGFAGVYRVLRINSGLGNLFVCVV